MNISYQPPNSSVIYPCPFSSGYGIPENQAWILLKVFFIYRVILAGLLLLLYFSRFGPIMLGPYDVQLYVSSSVIYVLISLVSGIAIFWQLLSYVFLSQTLIFTDIIILTLMMHACGGVSSGMGLLLVISTAAGGLLIGGRCAMLFAALASLAVLTEQVYASMMHNFSSTSYSYAGMLGAAFFAIALLSYVLAQRSEETDLIAAQRKQTIATLEELNQYIIQHLQSGIIITDAMQRIKMTNKAALRILNLPAIPDDLTDISKQLKQAFHDWRIEPERDFALITLAQPAKIQIRFSTLPTQHEIFYMIILEDIDLYNQRLQQSKLVSLGRLTASIAHEIRNPLGAISHAGQLLSESPELTTQDRRLTEIIQTHSARVNQIIESILQLSRRNPSKREKIHLQNWIKNYLPHLFQVQQIDRRDIVLELANSPLKANIDPGHLQQILDNLCQNAVRYGLPFGGKIIIRVARRKLAPCIEIIDSGPGINSEVKKHLFEPFFTTSSSGTGLGLYISRELAELNQAKLGYALNADGKSCFCLCLSDAENKMIEI